MRLLFLAKRWHLWRYRLARWLLVRAVNPLAQRLGSIAHVSGNEANALNSKAAQRMEICIRCPMFTAMRTCNACGCFMPAKVQLDSATCPQKRW